MFKQSLLLALDWRSDCKAPATVDTSNNVEARFDFVAKTATMWSEFIIESYRRFDIAVLPFSAIMSNKFFMKFRLFDKVETN